MQVLHCTNNFCNPCRFGSLTREQTQLLLNYTMHPRSAAGFESNSCGTACGGPACLWSMQKQGTLKQSSFVVSTVPSSLRRLHAHVCHMLAATMRDPPNKHVIHSLSLRVCARARKKLERTVLYAF